jgi:hypothetical protein
MLLNNIVYRIREYGLPFLGADRSGSNEIFIALLDVRRAPTPLRESRLLLIAGRVQGVPKISSMRTRSAAPP